MDMTYLINNEVVRCIKEGISYVLAELWVNSAADLPAADGITGRVLLPGTIAVVQAESAIYIMGFDEQWKEWGANNTSGTSAASTANSLDLSPRAIDRTALAEAANAAAIAAAINDDEIIAIDEPEQEEPEPEQEGSELEQEEPEPVQEEPEPEPEPEQENPEPEQEEPEPEQEAEEQPEQAETEIVKDGDADAEIYGGTESI